MQACIYEKYGPADGVTLAEVAKPEVGPNQVLVRVRAAQVTSADFRFRTSSFPGIFWLPGRLMFGLFRPRNRILGMDFSGVVAETGANATRFRVGDRVFGSTHWQRLGAHAEYVATEETAAVIHKPAFLTDQQAAAIPFGANSALAFLRDFAKVQSGQRVLIVGASGSVGSFAVQLARHFGADVTGVCSAQNAELVSSLGAHHVIDYASETFADGSKKYDLIFDTVGVTTFASCRNALSDQGTYLPLNAGLREIVQSVTTSFGRSKRVKYAVSSNTREALETITGLVEAGVVRPVIDRVYSMSEIADAHRHVEGRHKRGSVVVTMESPSA